MSKARKKPATRRPVKAKKPASSDKLGIILRALDAALDAYAPSMKRKMRPAGSFAALEKLGPVPAPLRALWSWCDGAAGLLRVYDYAVDLLTVARAAKALAELRRAAEDDDGEFSGVPFATEAGSGNYFVLDDAGRVRYWDHEEGQLDADVVAPSLAALLAKTLDSVKKNELFGGPEARPGQRDPKVTRVESLLKDPAKNFTAVIDATYRVGPVTMSAADAYRLRLALEPTAATLDSNARARYYATLGTSAREAGALTDAFECLKKAVGQDVNADWRLLGVAALESGAHALAAKAFALDRDEEILPSFSRIGAALAAWKSGAESKKLVASARRAVTKDLSESNEYTIMNLATLRAVVAHLEGDKVGVTSWLAKARAARVEGRAGPEDIPLAQLAALF